MDSLLSFIVFLPLVAGVLLMLVPKERRNIFRWGALFVMLATFLLSLPLVTGFETNAQMQFVIKKPWIPHFGVDYHLGVDGISLFLILLTTFLGPILVLSSFSAIEERVKEFYILLLVLQTGMLGAFAALDLFLFYVFWELMLLPMYLLIGVWGGKRRVYAAIKFVLYTIVGSLLMLVAILVLYFDHHAQTGIYTFNLLDLYRATLTPDRQAWLFGAFALAFAIKVPMFPLHTWLPDAHVEAPTAGSVVLAGVLLKMGTYGFVRFAIPLFPDAAVRFQDLFLVLSVIGIIYGALVAMVQTDVKKLVAYSSVSHLGYVMLGLFSFNTLGSSGALYQMLGHGLSTGALFLLVGIIYERRHTREISQFGGLATALPLFAFAFVFVTLSSIGLPGLNGFVGEFLILLGAFGEAPWAAILSASGVVLGAIYMLWLVRRFLFGPLSNPENQGLPDLSRREWAVLLPILVMIVVMGVQPKPFLERMEPALAATLARLDDARAEALLEDGNPDRASLSTPSNQTDLSDEQMQALVSDEQESEEAALLIRDSSSSYRSEMDSAAPPMGETAR